MRLLERRLKRSTREGYEHLLRPYLVPAVGHARLP